MIAFKQTRTQRAVRQLRRLRDLALDTLYKPAIDRLTTDQYFACRTRNECLAAAVTGRLPRRAGR